MLIDGKPTTAIWPDPNGEGVFILDQTRLPHAVATVLLRDLAESARAPRHGTLKPPENLRRMPRRAAQFAQGVRQAAGPLSSGVGKALDRIGRVLNPSGVRRGPYLDVERRIVIII